MLQASSIKKRADALAEKLVQIRRHLHQHPELSFEEYRTSDFIAEELGAAGIEHTRGHVKTGIIALIRGKNPGKRTILLRADMDALPIEEKNDVAYCSKNKGVMHACGHDVHSTCTLGAAFILQSLKHEFEGTVKIMFQPGEEVLPGGARLMIEEGILKTPIVEKAIALHVSPELQVGTVGFRSGMYMASTDELYITIRGKGGHAAMPASYINPLLSAAEFLLAVQERFMKKDALTGTPGETIPTVLAFGKIEGKGATNVIPETVELAGTFRTMNESWRSEVHALLKKMTVELAAKNGVKMDLEIRRGYPFLVNDKVFTENCIASSKTFLEEKNVIPLEIRMTAEDFAFISQEVPSCFFRLGTGNKNRGIVSGVHTATFDIDESALPVGAGLLAWLAIEELKRV